MANGGGRRIERPPRVRACENERDSTCVRARERRSEMSRSKMLEGTREKLVSAKTYDGGRERLFGRRRNIIRVFIFKFGRKIKI